MTVVVGVLFFWSGTYLLNLSTHFVVSGLSVPTETKTSSVRKGFPIEAIFSFHMFKPSRDSAGSSRNGRQHINQDKQLLLKKKKKKASAAYISSRLP